MRILYHHRTGARDGSAVHIDGLVGALLELGATVHVVAPAEAAGAAAREAPQGGLRALRKRLPRALHEIAEMAYNVPELRRLRREVRAFRPDILYQRSNLFLLSGASVAREFALPLIEEVNAPYFLERSAHGGIALQALAKRAERGAWQAADAVITVTQVLADMVAEQGVARERLHVMPNGIDASLLRADAIDAHAKRRLGLEGHTVLGFTGYVREWNGLDRVLALMARPAGEGWFLLVVGDGPARPGLEDLARSLGIADRVRFTGVVARPQVAGWVSAFDVALQPAANRYASPLKLFEYLALGRAVVAPRQPNITEVLDDGVNAMLFDPDSQDSLEAAVRAVALDPVLRSRLAAEARATVNRRQLTWRSNAERVLQLGARLIASRRAGG